MKRTPLLVDGDAMNIKWPDTFKIPHPLLKLALCVGDLVKVCVVSPDPSLADEVIWVELTKIRNGVFRGTVSGGLDFPEVMELDYRDSISFEARHILDIISGKELAKEDAKARAKLKSLDELVALPEGAKDHVLIDDELFKKLLLPTIPEGLLVCVSGDALPEIYLERGGDQIVACIILAFDPQDWKEKCDIRIFGESMVEAIKFLNTDGHPLDDPEFEDDGHIGARWFMSFAVSLHPSLPLVKIDHYCGRICRMAKQLVS